MTTHVTFGEVPAKKPPSREVLLAEQSDLRQRAEQIEYILAYISEDSYQRQELQSELQTILGIAAANQVLLDPKEADPEVEKRQRLEDESRNIQLQKMQAAHAEPSGDELATRRANNAKRREVFQAAQRG